MINSTLELTYGETVAAALSIKQMEAKGMKRRDAEDLKSLEYKLQIAYKGQKYRLLLIPVEESEQ